MDESRATSVLPNALPAGAAVSHAAAGPGNVAPPQPVAVLETDALTEIQMTLRSLYGEPPYDVCIEGRRFRTAEELYEKFTELSTDEAAFVEAMRCTDSERASTCRSSKQ